MLTRLRVQGFKNLLDVDLRFGPFTCIAGPNAAGKSNLFDAIRFLSLLTKHSIAEAVQLIRETRGRSAEPRSLFASFSKFTANEICFEAEMVINRDVQDDFGVDASAAISTLRYEVAFKLNSDNGADRLELVREALRPIKLRDAAQTLGFPSRKSFRESVVSGRRTVEFISTESNGTVRVHQEGHGGRVVPAPKSTRTVIGGTASSDFPTILAAHREMASWQTLLLEPSAMRAPSFYHDPQQIDARGAHIASTINRLEKKEQNKEQVCAELANRLSELVDDVAEVRVKDDEKTETLTVEVKPHGGTYHSARSLSDGTLRFLVLATLSLDPTARGVICLEEPENGIHPDRISAMVELLRDIAVDPEEKVGDDNPLRQVIVNTHSPQVISLIRPDELIYLDRKKLIAENAAFEQAAVTYPEGTWRTTGNGKGSLVPRSRLRSYLRRDTPQLWLPFENLS